MNLSSLLTPILTPAFLASCITKQWPHLDPELVTVLAALLSEYLREQIGIPAA